MSRSRFVLGFICFVSLFSSALYAQTSSGIIAGTITDSSGAAIPNATVTVVSKDTGEKRTVKTNGVGGYRIESVTPGVFSVTAEAANFQKTTIENIHVDASVVTSVNETLGIGAAELVEVSTDAATLSTESGAITGTLSSEAVDNLPIQGLNPYFLALTLPGVQPVGNTAFSNGINFSVNGIRSRANNFLIEGSDNNDAGIHGQGLQPENLDAIEQVVVLENAYQAEFGGGGGSVSNLIYKNGSNHFHGAVWDRILNSSLDAADKANFYSGGFKSKYRENIFGYDIGGYILKDKLFFFNSLQLDHYRSSTSSTLIVPTTSGIAQLKTLTSNPRAATLLAAISTLQGTDFTQDQIAANASGSTNFACIALSSLDPTPATAFCGANTVAVGPATRNIPADTNGPEFDNKVEYIPNQKDTLVFRYIRSKFDAPYDYFNYPSQLPGFDTTQYGVSHNAGITETHIFTPNILNDLRLSYGRIGFIFDFQPATYANPLGLTPTTSIPGVTGFGAPSGDPQSRQHNTYQLQDALSWNLKGRHALKMGFDVLDIRVRDAVPFNYYGSISYASSPGYSGLANYLDDFGGNNGSASIDFGNPIARPHLYEQNYYIQDTWKATEHLVMELGFRYEYEGAPFNSAQYPAFDINNPACTNPAIVAGAPVFCNVKEVADKGDWGPRFGFAYTPPSLNHKTVLRGGFGIFYDGLFTNIIDNTQASSPNAVAPEVISQAGTATRGLANFSSYLTNGTLSNVPTLGDLVESMKPTIVSPRTLQWNLNVQQELGYGFISQIGYVATRGEHLYATDESNPIVDPLNTGDRLFPNRGRILIRGNSGDSVYHSLQVEVNRSFSHGFLLRSAYTFSKAEDDVAEVFTSGNASQFGERQYPFPRKKVDYGLSPLDARHRFVLTYVYNPPKWHPAGYMKIASNVVNGFQIAGVNQFTSGNPGNIEVGYDYNGDGIGNDRPVLSNKLAPLNTYAFDRATFYDGNPGLCDGPTLYYTNDPCLVVTPDQVHFIVPAYGTNPTTIQRDSFSSLGNQEWDLSIQRTFHIHDSQNFDFRAEAFNVLNQGNTGLPNLTLTSINPDPSTFGPNTFGDQGITAAGHRNLRFYVKYSF